MTTRRSAGLTSQWLPWVAAAAIACSSLPDEPGTSGGTGGSAGSSAGTAGSATGGTSGAATGGTGGSSSARGGSAGSTGGTTIIPIGDAGTSGAGAPSDECNPKLVATIRDFDSSHVDFQEDMYNSPTGFGITGIVADRLVDGIPALLNAAPGGARALTDADSFATWFSTDHPDDATYLFDLDSGYLDKSEDDGVVTYSSAAFFPIDDEPSAEPGFDDSNGNEHNFHFTLELNTEFTYHAGDRFDFTGDDDIWVFIEDELVVDIGGVHYPDSGSIELDTLDLTEGEKYHLSLFYAERHTAQSNFKMTTTIEFTNCDPIIR